MGLERTLYVGAYLRVPSFGKIKVKEHPKKCTNCNVAILSNSKYCPRCGDKLELIECEEEISFYEFIDGATFIDVDDFYAPDLDIKENIILLNGQDDFINDEFIEKDRVNILPSYSTLKEHMNYQIENFNSLIKLLELKNIDYAVAYGIVEYWS